MAQYTADFEAGVNGATITTGAGEASATAWTQVIGTPSYSNAHPAHGVLAAKFTAADNYGRWQLAYAADSYGRLYLYATAVPGTTTAIVKFTAGGGAGGQIEIASDGKIQTRDAVSVVVAGSVATATNQLVRIEWHRIGETTTTGLFEVRLFNDAASTTPSDTISSTANRNLAVAACDDSLFGHAQFGPWGSDFWIDDIVANATTWVGPVPVAAAQALQPLRGGTGLW